MTAKVEKTKVTPLKKRKSNVTRKKRRDNFVSLDIFTKRHAISLTKISNLKWYNVIQVIDHIHVDQPNRSIVKYSVLVSSPTIDQILAYKNCYYPNLNPNPNACFDTVPNACLIHSRTRVWYNNNACFATVLDPWRTIRDKCRLG